MLYGRYEHNIDAKGRIFVPAKLREKLGDAFIAAAVMDHCICLYSLEEWDKLQEGLAQMPMTKARKLQRYLSANATDVQVDAQDGSCSPGICWRMPICKKRRWLSARETGQEIWNPGAYEEDIGRHDL